MSWQPQILTNKAGQVKRHAVDRWTELAGLSKLMSMTSTTFQNTADRPLWYRYRDVYGWDAFTPPATEDTAEALNGLPGTG